MVVFSQSSYRFTDPIRYFKANDPIYYEVDNIPLKQLQENNLWLKEQLENLELPRQQEIGRSTFTELQPYIDGSDNTVYVRPGRYSARINDVFNLQAMQLLGIIPSYEDIVTAKNNSHAYIQQIIDKVRGVVAADSLALNGLVERTFTKASSWHHTVSKLMLSSTVGYDEARLEQLQFGGKWPYPMYKGMLYTRNGVYSPAYDPSSVAGLKWNFIEGQSLSGNDLGYAGLAVLEGEFMKKWRGVARTSIVDIPQEISIEIPAFDPEDYFYYDSNGVKTLITQANQRIDLLFIYSKPIDTSAATIAKFINGGNTPSKIYSPQLGIVKGAGLGLNKRSTSDPTLSQQNYGYTTPLQDDDGNNLMLASHADTLNQYLGFSSVKGSFPSPDDLLNFAPTLADIIESNHMALLGQSILPIAYIVVRKEAALNENGIPRLTSNDLIDIRPFFRTTELTYNERAGIAAAHPQISLANPVATQSYVDLPVKDLSRRIDEVDARIPVISNVQTPRIVSTGYICGGTFYGVESTLLDLVRRSYPNQSGAFYQEKVKEQFAYPANVNINGDPQWDIAPWTQFYPGGGSVPTNYLDWLHITNEDVFSKDGNSYGGQYSWFNTFVDVWVPNALDGYNAADKERVRRLQRNFDSAYSMAFGRQTDFVQGTGGGQFTYEGEGNSYTDFTMCYVKKKIVVNTSQVPWAGDFTLKASYHNCTCKNGPSDIIVNKEKNLNTGNIEFTIMCPWYIKLKELPRGLTYTGLAYGDAYVPNSFIGGLTPFPNNQYTFPLRHLQPAGRDGPGYAAKNYNGFLVLTDAISRYLSNPGAINGSNVPNTASTLGASTFGVALYPSVKFEVVGIPAEFINNAFNYQTRDLILR